MSEVSSLPPEQESLVEYTDRLTKKNVAISWYRSPLAPADVKSLHQRSDLKGFIQTAGYLAILALAGGVAFYSWGHWPWWATVGTVFLYGMVTAFLINGVHELGHGTVFKTKWLNSFFCHILAFLGWINHEAFQTSHMRHHRYTLHPPDDLEVTLPNLVIIKHIFLLGIFDPSVLWRNIKGIIRIARGRFEGEWEMTLYPEDAAQKRWPAIRWARIVLVGHITIVVVSLATGYWIIPVLTTLNQAYGTWLFLLCNHTQHTGMQDHVSDFRLCCRTFTLNPFVRFLYWQMNYHIEHHMFAAVPCYNLKRLHSLIKHDLPPCPHGILAVWKQIAEIQAKQAKDPTYQYQAPLPTKA